MVFWVPVLFFFRFFLVLLFQNLVKASDILKLNEVTFKQTIEQPGIFLVEFFAPWCGHCKALAPEYEEAATQLKDKGITLIQVDCTVETQLCDTYEVSGYPTLKIFRDGEHTPYDGPRKAQAIVSYMIKQTFPVTTLVDQENYELFKESDDVVLLAFISEEDKMVHDSYHKLAKVYRNKYVFGVSSDATIAKTLNVEFPSVVMFRKTDDALVVYEGQYQYDALEQFVLMESLPLLGELRPDTYENYISTKLPLACIFVSSDDEKKNMVDLFLSFAKMYRGRMNFATIDATMYGGHAENLNLKQIWPALAIQETLSNKKYPFRQEENLDRDNIGKFLDDYVSFRLVPSIKSEPVPEIQSGPVVVVVADNFKEIVQESSKDVLLEFYAPWCGHCKNLAPKYEELGKLFWTNPDLRSKVIIAKMDATANDLEDYLDIKGFPTIMLFPAGDKLNPIEYNGPRTVDSLIEFIYQKGTHKVDASGKFSVEFDSSRATESVDSSSHDEL